MAQPGQVGEAVRSALELGYRHIDCAAGYGNEAEIGDVLSDVLGSGSVAREDIFVTSKLWNSEHQPKDVLPALQQTLRDLKLDYVDLYLIHWPQNFAKQEEGNSSTPRHPDGSIVYDFETTTMETWRAMEALVDMGLAKAIGLSNFNEDQINEIITHGTIKPAMLQVEIHPYFAQQELSAFCAEHQIGLTAYSPLGSGNAIGGMTVVENPVLVDIGSRYRKSPAQVVLAWLLQRNIIVIPKSVTAERIAANIEVAFELSADEMAAVDSLDQGFRNGWGGPQVERDGEMQPRDLGHPLYVSPLCWTTFNAQLAPQVCADCSLNHCFALSQPYRADFLRSRL